MLNIISALKYDMPYKGAFDITQCCTNRQNHIIKCWTNVKVTKKYCAERIGYNTSHINPYTSGTNFENNITENDV